MNTQITLKQAKKAGYTKEQWRQLIDSLSAHLQSLVKKYGGMADETLEYQKTAQLFEDCVDYAWAKFPDFYSKTIDFNNFVVSE